MNKKLLFALFFLPALLHADPKVPVLEISGEGEVKVEPNQVIMQFGIETRNKDLEKAKDENVVRSKSLTDALKKLGIAAKDIKMSYLNISPRYDYPNNRRVFVEYMVSKSFTVTLNDTAAYGKVLNAALAAGVENIGGVQYGRSDEKELEIQARKRAADDAKAKAQAMAAEFGMKAGQPVLIQVSDIERPFNPMQARGMMKMAMDSEAAVDQLSAGEISVKARVLVHFKLLDK